LTVEPLPIGATLESFYDGARQKLGESFTVTSHGPWQGGYVDVMRTETPIAVSYVKRFSRVEGRRAYTLSFEARDDVFPRVTRWYDGIASTFKTGADPVKP
jgi:hypothetical protein